MAITMKQNEIHTVFVYGTLKTDYANHRHYMKSATYIGEFQTNPRWGLIDLGAFPAMVQGDMMVKGEVFAVDSATLARLDILEGIAVGLYSRRRIDVIDREGMTCSAWVYVYNAIPRQNTILTKEW